MKTFLEMAVMGQIELDRIEDFVDRWHESNAQCNLPAYLGMTEDEYALWVEKPESLELIIQAHVEGMCLAKIS